LKQDSDFKYPDHCPACKKEMVRIARKGAEPLLYWDRICVNKKCCSYINMKKVDTWTAKQPKMSMISKIRRKVRTWIA
jgi:NAD-dependent DNA ligase